MTAISRQRKRAYYDFLKLNFEIFHFRITCAKHMYRDLTKVLAATTCLMQLWSGIIYRFTNQHIAHVSTA
ncbi:hypothetical protein BKM17_11020 [Pseudomonas syringae group genomosp. 3]|nr:hypothetical protein BKM17_11020 [Pseudomonas syringae group genomosp. 3]